jgi:hypothetical protein
MSTCDIYIVVFDGLLLVIFILDTTVWKILDLKIGNVRIAYIEARSSNHCCSGEAMKITQPEFVYL